MAAPRAVLLLGPTACGKSAFALQLAHALPLEIVSVDSAQVYRGMDIGTAKPGPDERARVPHHLIDLCDPAQPYSAAQFVADATAAATAIAARGALPLLAGGTMLYAHALRNGLAALPSADPSLRARIEAQARALGWPALHARLARLDPVIAARLSPNDGQRIQRALEVHALTGRPLSALQAERPPPPLHTTTIALLPADRGRLHERIAARFDAMLAQGLLDEVRGLRARGDLHAELPSMRSVGYRQAWDHLERHTPFAELRTAGIAATRQLARRQSTWLRAMPDATVIDPFAPDALAQVLAAVRTAVQG